MSETAIGVNLSLFEEQKGQKPLQKIFYIQSINHKVKRFLNRSVAWSKDHVQRHASHTASAMRHCVTPNTMKRPPVTVRRSLLTHSRTEKTSFRIRCTPDFRGFDPRFLFVILLWRWARLGILWGLCFIPRVERKPLDPWDDIWSSCQLGKCG